MAAVAGVVLLLFALPAKGASAPLYGAGTNTSAVGFPFASVIQDVNGDVFPDLVVAEAGTDSVAVLLGNGDGTFGAPSSFPVGATQPIGVVLADFNGDLILDVATANYLSKSVSILEGDGAGSFVLTGTFTVDLRPFTVAVGHFNGDLNADLVTANQDSDDVSAVGER
jgi:hypothetical protein